MKTVTILFGIFVLLIMAVPVTADTSTISSISPKIGYQDSPVTVTLTGTFTNTTPDDVVLMKSGEGNVSASVSSHTDTEVICTFSSGKMNEAEAGTWNIVILNEDGSESAVKTNAFTVRPEIKVTSISPSSARTNKDDVELSVGGSGLSEITGIYLHNTDYGNITGTHIDPISSSKVNATFDFDDKEIDSYEVCVKDDFGTIVCNDDVIFKVTSDKVGSIELSSSPSEAAVYLDGVSKGNTPITLSDLDVGTYKVMIKKSGYNDWNRAVKVADGDTASFTANLEKTTAATTATPTSAPTTVPTSIKVTRKPTTATATPWPSDTPTPASPVDLLVIVGAVGFALLALRRH